MIIETPTGLKTIPEEKQIFIVPSHIVCVKLSALSSAYLAQNRQLKWDGRVLRSNNGRDHYQHVTVEITLITGEKIFVTLDDLKEANDLISKINNAIESKSSSPIQIVNSI